MTTFLEEQTHKNTHTTNWHHFLGATGKPTAPMAPATG